MVPSTRFLHNLSLYRLSTPILPNVKYVTTQHERILPYIPLFLSDNTLELTILIRNSSIDRIMDILDTLKYLTPRIEALNFDPRSQGPSPQLNLVDGSLELPRLRSFTFINFTLNKTSFLTLASLMSLGTLEVTIPFDPPIYLRPPAFPSLSTITIVMSDILHATSLLKSITSTLLSHVRFELQHRCTSTDLQEFLESLLDHSSRGSFNSIGIVPHGDWPQNSMSIITSANVRPLLKLNNLLYVSIEVNCHFDFDDALLNDMALSWPHLNTLLLVPPDDGLPDDIKVTLNSLIPFAMYCPRLVHLGFVLDARHIPDDYHRVKPGERHIGRHLVQLEVYNSPIEDSIEVAAFLSGLFPRSDLEYHRRSLVAHSDTWNQVYHLLNIFSRVRDQERRLAVDVGVDIVRTMLDP